MIKLFYCCLLALPLRHLSLTSGYGFRLHPVTGQFRFHAGIDLRAKNDTVFAVMPGRITSVGYDAITGVHIRLSSGDFTILYGHLSQVFVLPGDSVNSCTPLGVTGATGRVTGEHLHFSVRYRGRLIDPLHFLTQLNSYDNSDP